MILLPVTEPINLRRLKVNTGTTEGDFRRALYSICIRSRFTEYR